MRILFVCTGNTCRSPMAETIARAQAKATGLTGMEFRSAGVHAFSGSPASDGARFVAQEQGLSLEAHRAMMVTPALLRWADVILTMGTSHLQALEGMPGANGDGPSQVATLLGTVASRGLVSASHRDPQVPDPFGGSHGVYRETWRALESMVAQALLVLSGGVPGEEG